MDRFSFFSILVCFLIVTVSVSCSEMDEISLFLDTDARIIETMESYIQGHQKRLDRMKREIEEVYMLRKMMTERPEVFEENPINAFLFAKKITLDWKTYPTFFDDDFYAHEIFSNFTAEVGDEENFPVKEDLDRILFAIYKIIDGYQLNVTDFANGVIMGRQIGYRSFTASDCFEIGRFDSDIGGFDYARIWFEEAASRLEREEYPTLERSKLLENLAHVYYKKGDIEKAIQITQEILDENPNNKDARRLLSMYQLFLRRRKEKEIALGGKAAEGDAKALNEALTSDYVRLCRGEVYLNTSKTKNLYCFYKSGSSSNLLIAPVKAEVVHIDPTLVIYHNIIRQSEIDAIKKIGVPKLKDATVNSDKAPFNPVQRTSLTVFLEDLDAPEVNQISQRLQDITGNV